VTKEVTEKVTEEVIISIARNLKSQQIDLETIINVTGLSREEIAKRWATPTNKSIPPYQSLTRRRRR
jgi:hypothetical protein